MSRPERWLAAALLAELAVAATTVVLRSLPTPVPPAAAPAPAPVSTPAPVAVRSAPTPARVPDLVVDQPLVPLGVERDGRLEVPSRASQVGRWADGPLPGDTGPAVLVAHVDLDGRRGAFSGLSLLVPGDVVRVRRPDGRLVDFRVTRTERVAKGTFPTEAVYGPTTERALRLVTCGGSFDRLRGHYRDNVVVYAVA